jgi:hypothetical protein
VSSLPAMSSLPARYGLLLAAVLGLCACGEAAVENAAGASGDEASAAVAVQPTTAAGLPTPAQRPAPGGGGAAVAARADELTNPEGTTVVLLYHDLAGLALPLERWVENDSRVRVAPANARAAARDVARGEIEAAAAALRSVGRLRITLDANLSDYDPAYQEFTVRALAPSSAVTYDGFDQKVDLRFANGLDAQTWAVPAEEAQAIIDRIGPSGRVDADIQLRITGSQPAPRGGTIVTEVVEYELRQERNGHLVGRRQVIP